jgi:hypothetical protein
MKKWGLNSRFLTNDSVVISHITRTVTSVADPDPPDPHVFGPPRSGSGSCSGSGSGSFRH